LFIEIFTDVSHNTVPCRQPGTDVSVQCVKGFFTNGDKEMRTEQFSR